MVWDEILRGILGNFKKIYFSQFKISCCLTKLNTNYRYSMYFDHAQELFIVSIKLNGTSTCDFILFYKNILIMYIK